MLLFANMTLIQLDVDTRQNTRHFTTAQANLEACLGARDTLTSLIALPTHRSLSPWRLPKIKCTFGRTESIFKQMTLSYT